MTVRPVASADVIDLRHRVLRVGLPRESARFEGDDEPSTAHFAATDDAGAIVGCATILRRPRPGDGQVAWQLRGMAVDPAARRAGVGGALLRAVDAHVRAAPLPGRDLWCNARLPAVAFYARHGWATASDVFDIPTAGPHRVMTKTVSSPPGRSAPCHPEGA